MHLVKSIALFTLVGIGTTVMFQNCAKQNHNSYASTNIDTPSQFDDIKIAESISGIGAIDLSSITLERDAQRIRLNSFTLRPNQGIDFGDLTLAFQTDGNLVLYQNNPQMGVSALWTSQTQSLCTTGNCVLTFDSTFGFRLTNNGTLYWSSRNSRQAGLSLELATIAPFISIKTLNGKRIWSGLSRLNWLSFLDPIAKVYGQDRPGVVDYDSLLSAVSLNDKALRKIHVIRVYQQFIQMASDAELQRLFRFLNERNIALALEYGAVELTAAEWNVCGQNIEGSQPIGAAATFANKIHRNGGRLAFVAMDEPVYYSHYRHGTVRPFVSCQFSITQLAQKTAQTYLEYYKLFPDVIYGDIEPFFAIPVGADKLEWSRKYFEFVDRFETYSGSPIQFVHDDTNMDEMWSSRVSVLHSQLLQRQTAYGMIWNGSAAATSSVNWVTEAISKIQKYRSFQLRSPDQNIFQSWDQFPNRVLSEFTPDSLLYLVSYYFNLNPPVAPPQSKIPVYRFYSATRGDHDYNVTTVPRPGYRLEGEAFRIFSNTFPGALELYRCRIPSNDRTHLSNLSNCEGMQVLARLGFLGSSATPETPTPLFRCFHPVQGRHFVTKNTIECTSNGFNIEGPIGFIE